MIFSQQKTRYGTTEEKPKIGSGKDKGKPEEVKEPDAPGKPDEPGSSVYVIQATNYIDGNIVPTIVGAYTEQALTAFLAEKGYTLGANDLVYPIYRVKQVEVKK